MGSCVQKPSWDWTLMMAKYSIYPVVNNIFCWMIRLLEWSSMEATTSRIIALGLIMIKQIKIMMETLNRWNITSYIIEIIIFFGMNSYTTGFHHRGRMVRSERYSRRIRAARWLNTGRLWNYSMPKTAPRYGIIQQTQWRSNRATLGCDSWLAAF